MVKSFSSIVGMLIVAQTYAVNPATQQDRERPHQAIQVREKQQKRQVWKKDERPQQPYYLEQYHKSKLRRHRLLELKWQRHQIQDRQRERQVTYLEEHPDCKNKINRLKPKLIILIDLTGQEEDALKQRLLDTTDEVADAYREALLALNVTSFDNPSKAIQEEAKKVRHSIITDGDNTVSSLLALLKMLKNKTPNNE